MLEPSVFTNSEIISVVQEEYHIKVREIRKINEGSANIYIINNNQYVLKEFPSWYTKDNINKEARIITHLQKDGIPVANYIKTINNDYSFLYKNRVVILQKFIEGKTLKLNTATEQQVFESMEYLGKIIKSLESLDFNLEVNTIISPEIIAENILKLKKLLLQTPKKEYSHIYKDLQIKLTILEDMQNNLNFKDLNHLTIMNTHGDYNILQFIYKNNQINAILDFASATKMPIVWEIIRSYSYIDKKAKNGTIDINNLIKCLQKINKYIKLNSYDLEYMPIIYMLQLAGSSFGYKEYLKDNSKQELLTFAYFRTNLCRYLYTNKEIISNALKNEFLS